MVPVHAHLCAIPNAAHGAGFDRPVLHGRASSGIAGHALLKTICDYAPERLAAMAGRRDCEFSARVVGPDVIATDNGRAEVR
jgi:acyl dehydratase